MTSDCKYQPVALDSPSLKADLYYEMALDSSKRSTKKWEIFAGRNRFYCDGRLMTAPHSGVFILTICLITGTSALFFIFDCQYLAENVTIAIPIVGAILFLFTMLSLLRTSLTDPGIIPRATPEEAAYVEKQIDYYLEVTNSANSPTYRPPPRTKEVLIKGQTVKLKYCFTCKIFRPPRASHCSLCDNCVDRFDHHCPWVGNCVGRRNYRFFYMFIVSLAFLAVFIFSCAIAHIILITKEDRQFLDAVRDSPASIIVAVVCFFSVWSILGLAGFHTYLTTSNQTTNEDIKGSFTGKRGQESFNPYSQGNFCLNCFHILCGPLTPSLIDRRGLVTDEYRLELTNPVITADPITLKSYGTTVQMNGQLQINVGSDIPGLYRQTTENIGTYRPLQKSVYRTHYIVPSNNCANKRITPTHSQLLYYDASQRCNDSKTSPIKNSASLPRIKNYSNHNNILETDLSSNSPLKFERQSFVRPYTPPEKRYSANFAKQLPEKKSFNKSRSKSSYVFENIYAQDDFCTNKDCNAGKTRSDRVTDTTNLKVKQFPSVAFNSLYIQENLN